MPIKSLKNNYNNSFRSNSVANITLQPGVNVYRTENNSTLNNSTLNNLNVKGKTLLNTLGRNGNFDTNVTVTGFFNAATASVLTSEGVDNSGCLQIKLAQASGTAGLYNPLALTDGKYYLAVAMVKNVTTTNCSIGIEGAYGNLVTDKSNYKPVFLRFTGSQVGGSTRIGIFAQGAVNNTALMDRLRVYEITAEENTTIDTMTPEQVDTKYPYVESVQPVKNPYIIRYGANLMPPLYEWIVTKGPLDKVSLIKPYELYAESGDNYGVYLKITVNCASNTSYRFNSDAGMAYIEPSVVMYDNNDIAVGATGNMPGAPTFKFTTPANAVRLEITIRLLGATTFKNPTLTIGNDIKPFKPREDSMLALQTDLYADPLTGLNYDEVFEEDNQYFKITKWKKIIFDQNYQYSYYNSYSGGKCVRLNYDIADRDKTVYPFVTKYNGSILSSGSPSQAVDQYSSGDWGAGNNGPVLGIGVSNTESGWGQRLGLLYEVSTTQGTVNYPVANVPTGLRIIPTSVNISISGSPYTNFTVNGNTIVLAAAQTAGQNIIIRYDAAYEPTADEVKAFFMGWVMYDGSLAGGAAGPDNPPGNVYIGTGTKSWCYRTNEASKYTGATSTLPTTVAPNWTPYQLVYQLNDPIVEPVASEGMITLNEGDNQIEVGTGIVLRESALANHTAEGLSYLNATYPLKFKSYDIKGVFKNGLIDTSWKIGYRPTTDQWYPSLGRVYEYIPTSLFDKFAVYSVTYLMMDKSPIVPFIGTYATNEKAMLQELTETVQQNATVVSALVNKKIDKDLPIVWIKPTLLNGWSSVSGETLQFTKTGNRVQITGRVSGGIITNGVVLFRLPAGYRPMMTVTMPIYYSTGSTPGAGELVVGTDGSVLLYVGGNAYIDCANITFLAEH